MTEIQGMIGISTWNPPVKPYKFPKHFSIFSLLKSLQQQDRNPQTRLKFQAPKVGSGQPESVENADRDALREESLGFPMRQRNAREGGPILFVNAGFKLRWIEMVLWIDFLLKQP